MITLPEYKLEAAHPDVGPVPHHGRVLAGAAPVGVAQHGRSARLAEALARLRLGAHRLPLLLSRR